MRVSFRLNLRSPSMPIDLDFPAVAAIINNPTGSPVFLRIGAPDAPTATNADLFVPAGESMSYPVSGYTFAAAFGNVAAIQSTDIIASGLFQTCIITFLSAGETIPSYGSASFLSLSISDLWSNMAGAGPLTFPVIDLGPWGGAIVFIAPTAASGQGILQIEFSVDQVTWVTAGQWAFWPSIPSTLNVQRVARYARVRTLVTGIPAEPALAYAITARASLSEIAQLTYVPFTSSIAKVLNVPNLGEQDFILCTTNTPAIDVSVDITSAGSGAAAEEIICETSLLPIGPWQTVSFREQNAGTLTGDLFRSYGNLNAFTRIRMLEIGGGGPLGGTISFSIRPAPDLSGVLQSIYAALGDVGYSVNVNQDIFHLLQHIETWTGQASVSVASIDTKMSTVITSLSTINTSLGTINTSIGTVNTSIGTSNTNLALLTASLSRTSAPTQNVTNIVAAAAVPVLVGAVIIAGWFISEAWAAAQPAAGAAAGSYRITMFTGTGAAAVTAFYTSQGEMAVAGTGFECQTKNYTSNRSPGFLIPAGQGNLWVSSTLPLPAFPTQHSVLTTLTQTSP